jgi:hypothetical protein
MHHHPPASLKVEDEHALPALSCARLTRDRLLSARAIPTAHRPAGQIGLNAGGPPPPCRERSRRSRLRQKSCLRSCGRTRVVNNSTWGTPPRS